MEKNRLWQTFQALIDIDSPTFGERALCDFLKTRLLELGVSVYEDGAGEQIGGNCGNLYGFLPGGGAPLLFSAHMDTVEPARGKKAVLGKDGFIRPEGDTILGADDGAGMAVILEALARLKEEGIPHRPIELLFPVAEEKYGLGSAAADYSRLHSKEAYVLDLEGEIGEAANAAPTLLSFEVTVKGKAAHAGFAPKEGVHALAAAAKAVARLPLGEAEPGLTCNVGTMKGGEADNIVPALAVITGEIRSLSHEKALACWERVKAAFEEEAKAAGATVKAEMRLRITAYETPLDAPVAARFRRACQEAGVPCRIHATLGGSDNNNFARAGIEGLVIACSMHRVHSTEEYSRLEELEACVRLVMSLMKEEV